MGLSAAEDDEYEVDRAHNLNLLAAMCTEARPRSIAHTRIAPAGSCLKHTECARWRPGCRSPRHVWMLGKRMRI